MTTAHNDEVSLLLPDDGGFEFSDRLVCFCCHLSATKIRKSNDLIHCSGCHIAHYCSEECRDEHISSHKEICFTFKSLQKEVSVLENLFYNEAVSGRVKKYYYRVYKWDNSQDLASLFFLKKWKLACQTLKLAVQGRSKNLQQTAIGHAFQFSQCERQRDTIPVFLMDLKCSDDAFDFIQYWIRQKIASEHYVEVEIFSPYQVQFPYTRKAGSRFDDVAPILQTHDLDSIQRMSLLLFVYILLVIKARVVAEIKARKKFVLLLFMTTSSDWLHPVRSIIEEFVVGSQSDVRFQEHQVRILLDFIDEINPSLLPSILHPKPLLSQMKPLNERIGFPSEAYEITQHYKNMLLRVRGAEPMLVARYGRRTPLYNYKIAAEEMRAIEADRFRPVVWLRRRRTATTEDQTTSSTYFYEHCSEVFHELILFIVCAFWRCHQLVKDSCRTFSC